MGRSSDSRYSLIASTTAAIIYSLALCSSAATMTDTDCVAAASPATHNLMVIDDSVQDADLLTQDLAHYEILRIGPNQAPLEAIATEAARLGNLRTLVIVSHGVDGGLSLGGQLIDRATLLRSDNVMSKIGRALSDDGEIMLYGCDVAATTTGQAFVRTLAEMSDSSVAASTNATGYAGSGADWDLEYSVGIAPIRSPFSDVALKSYRHTLSHFRGGAITWQAVELDGDGLKNDVQITVNTAWRYNSINSVSSLSSTASLTITQLSENRVYVNGDANGADYALQTTILEARNLDPDTHYVVGYTGCCRISNLQNNADGDWNIQAEISLKDGNLAPKIDLPIIFQVPQLESDSVTPLTNWMFDVNSSDPNADKLRYRLANLTELGGGSSTNPSGLSINPNTGQMTWSGSGGLTSGLYSGGIVAEDLDTTGSVKSKSHVDFIFDLQPKAAVTFTPSSNIPETRNVRVEKGTTYSFDLTGAAIDTQSLGDVQGALTEPTEGNYVFDPGPVGSGLNSGSYPITFEIRDTEGTQGNSYLTINFIVPEPNAPQISNIEGDRTVYSATVAQLVDENLDAVVGDADDSQLNGGQLKFNVTFTDGQYEILGVQSVGDSVGEIRRTDDDIFFEGNLIGVVDGIEDGVGRALRIDFTTADATIVAVQALVRSLTYEDTFQLRASGDRSLSVFIKDPSGSANAYDFFIDIQAHPNAPAPGGGPVQAANNLTIVEGGTIALSDENINYADPDGDTITLTPSNIQHGQFELVSNPGVAITSFTQDQVTLGQIAFAHDDSEIGPSYDISASDGNNPATLPATATIQFTRVNDNAPVISGTPTTTGTVGDPYSFVPLASDADVGGTITFSITNQPAWTSFDTLTGELSGTPATGDDNTYTNIVITATDNGGLSDSLAAFSITITDPCVTDPNGVTCLAADSDGDGLTNADEDLLGTDRNNPDTDGDGTNDGAEVGNDVNNPIDSDADGLPDVFESGNGDQDNDGIVDSDDDDSDNDSIPDGVEAGTNPANPVDSDNDGIADLFDRDSDDDGIPDAIEAGPTPAVPVDSDIDSIPDYLDVDSDNDGLPDSIEDATNGLDSDGDGIDDFYDADVSGGPDLNGDGIDDTVGALDSDSDGLANSVDIDSDNDGIGDLGETDMTGADSDGDGIDDALDPQFTGGFDQNGDGIDDAYVVPDTDLDGIPDFIDLDSDNDAINDVVEAGLADLDDDAFVDAGQSVTNMPPDSDGDTTPDYRDLDSDDDGSFDIGGTLFSALDSDNDGRIDAGSDVDSDGIIDSRDQNPLFFGNQADSDGDGVSDIIDADMDNDGIPNDLDGIDVDTDGDGIPNALDLDSDNDGIPDIVEGGGVDADADGTIDAFTDSDNDGLADQVDTDAGGVPLPVPDTDGDGSADFIDLDSDGDGLTDVEEGPGDSDGDGIPNFRDAQRGLETALSGTGSLNIWLLQLLLIMVIAFRWWPVIHRRGAVMPMICIVLLSGAGPARTAHAQTFAGPMDDHRLSVAIEWGVSWLNPRESGDFIVTDDKSQGYRLSGAYRWSDKWYFEAFYMDSGAARIASSDPLVGALGDLKYRQSGVGAAYRFLPDSDLRILIPYVKAGIVHTENSVSDSRILYGRRHPVGLYFGTGIAWQLSDPWQLFSELVTFDRDEASLTVGVRLTF